MQGVLVQIFNRDPSFSLYVDLVVEKLKHFAAGAASGVSEALVGISFFEILNIKCYAIIYFITLNCLRSTS